MMAAIIVAETNELIEQILQRLPVKDILLARGVSRHWKDIVETSLPLKIATFRAGPLVTSTYLQLEFNSIARSLMRNAGVLQRPLVRNR